MVLVVDGAVPAAKAETSTKRAMVREWALDEMENSSQQAQSELAEKAAQLTPEIIRRMLVLVQAATECECMVAPFEADGQLQLLERLCNKTHARVFVYAADSDLMVLGVESLLWEVKVANCGINGQVCPTINDAAPYRGDPLRRPKRGLLASTPRVWTE